MPIPLSELLNRVPPETRSVVDKTRQRYSRVIRRVLRDETRLQLTRTNVEGVHEENEVGTVVIFVIPGIPLKLQTIEFDDSAWLAIELAPLIGLLETARKASDELSPSIEQLVAREAFQSTFPDADLAVNRMRDLAAALLREAAKFDIF